MSQTVVRRPSSRLLLSILLCLVTACERTEPAARSASVNPHDLRENAAGAASTPTLAVTLASSANGSPTRSLDTSPLPNPEAAEAESATPMAIAAATAGVDRLPRCGINLPILAEMAPSEPVHALDTGAIAPLKAIVPSSALPALEHLLASPETVGLVAYRVGQESEGVFLNADVPMPLASVVKLIHLVAYTERVASGELDPLEFIQLDDLERYYLPGLDLGAHTRAIRELEEQGRLLQGSKAVRLEDVPWMMIRHSSNAATDYLHMRIGQEAIEETALDLGLTTQTAPCPFLGQFLAMSNHTRSPVGGIGAIEAYVAEPESYGREAMALTLIYSDDPSFRQAEISRRGRTSLQIQRMFTENLNPQASARQYASLMAKLAQNGLSDADSSFWARRYLEWPMQFQANQELFSNLGYKNGTLPGILTTVYYAYPIGDARPTVVALFFRELPNRTYQQWRRSLLPHDELARWLLAEPAAIPAMRAVLGPPG